MARTKKPAKAAAAKKKKGGGSSLGPAIIALVAIAVALVAGTVAALTQLAQGSGIRQELSSNLTGSLSMQTAFQQQRYRRLQLISRIFATDLVLPGYLAKAAASGDAREVLDFVEEYQNILSFDLGVVIDPTGRVIAHTDDPAAAGTDLSDRALVQVVQEENPAFGIWRDNEELFHAVAVELVSDFDAAGYLIIGLEINDALALQLSRISGDEIFFLADVPGDLMAVTASSGQGIQPDQLIGALRRSGDVWNRVISRGATLDDVSLELDNGERLLAIMPLRDASETPVGAAVALTDLSGRLAPFQQILFGALGAAGVALLLAGPVALMLARGTRRALVPLAAAADEVAAGNVEIAVPEGSGGEASRIAGGLEHLLRQVRGRRLVDAFVSHVARFQREPALGSASIDSRPRAEKITLLLVEMRRFANPKAGYDPEESLSRFSRDLRKVVTAIESRRGQLESVQGHRLLATFEGDDGAFRALGAGAETMHRLSERENVFDEPEPPAVVLASGSTVIGPVTAGQHASSGVLGLPVQMLESLVREAAPGEVYLAKPVVKDLLPTLQQAQIAPTSQRGIMSTMPIYTLKTEDACRLAGVDTTPRADTAFPGDKLSPSEVKAGMLLGGRFEVLDEIGTGTVGSTFKVRDRDRHQLGALELLDDKLLADPTELERLKNLIRAIRSFNHPHLIGIFDFGEADGIPYFLLEYVRGMSLRFVIDQSRRVPVAVATRFAEEICHGLDGAHGMRVLHRSVKPENVLVETTGRIKLAGLGLSPPMSSPLGMASASPPYLAPEQLAGHDQLTPAVDVYATGVVLYEMLTGKLPVSGATPAEIRARHDEGAAIEPPSVHVPEVPPRLEQIVLTCLAKTPAQRYETAAALAEDLAAVG
ncbi:MAG: protein kinase [Acidobacteriota bacterium]